jgi:hypothetical protein
LNDRLFPITDAGSTELFVMTPSDPTDVHDVSESKTNKPISRKKRIVSPFVGTRWNFETRGPDSVRGLNRDRDY